MFPALIEKQAREALSLSERVQAAVKECQDVCKWADIFVAVVSDVVPYHDVFIIPCMNMDADIADGFIARFPSAKITFWQREDEND